MRSLKYNLKYLNEVISNYKATLLNSRTFINFNFTYNTKINYKCNCGADALRTFKQIEITGAYCKKCIKINAEKKRRETLLNKYGVEHLQQLDEFKERRNENNLKKYGVKNVTQNSIIKEKIKNTNLDKYGVSCFLKTDLYKEKTRKTMLKRYGVENIADIKDIREKVKLTNLKKYGVEFPSQTEQIKNKIKQTNLNKYGVECSLHAKCYIDKIKKTCLERYGVENPAQSEIIQDNRRQTNLNKYGVTCNLHMPSIKSYIQEKKKQNSLIKYGVEHPMQNDEIIKKCFNNAFQSKDYTLPSGKKIKYMGYENKAIDILLYRHNINEVDIINNIKEVPKIWYIDLEVKRRYIPDIFIKSQNKIIEVKSTWTFNKNYDCNIKKARACKILGYKFEFWIFNEDKDINPTIIVM